MGFDFDELAYSIIENSISPEKNPIKLKKFSKSQSSTDGKKRKHLGKMNVLGPVPHLAQGMQFLKNISEKDTNKCRKFTIPCYYSSGWKGGNFSLLPFCSSDIFRWYLWTFLWTKNQWVYFTYFRVTFDSTAVPRRACGHCVLTLLS